MILQFPSPPPSCQTRVTFRRGEGGRFALIATVTVIDDDHTIVPDFELCSAICNGPTRRSRYHPAIAAANDGTGEADSAVLPFFRLPPFYLLPHPARR